MAFVGLAKPLIAKLTQTTADGVTTDAYSGGFGVGKAITTSINPNFNEGSVYGDNTQVLYDKEFKDADVSLGTTRLPIEAASTIFGHTVDTETNKVTYAVSDKANYVGMGFYTTEKDDDGNASYVATFLPKVKFADASDDFSTKGDKIEFKTPTISGKALSNGSGQWKVTEIFDTEELALSWLQTQLNITVA